MNARLRPISLSLLLLVAVLALTVHLGGLGSLHAAQSGGAVPLVTIAGQQKTGTYVQNNSKPSGGSNNNNNNNNSNNNSNGKSSNAVDEVSATTAKAWVELTVRNVGEGPIKGLTINYHTYVQTINSGGDNSGTTMSDTTGSATIDIPVGGKVLVKTTPIDKSTTSTAHSNSSKGVKSTSATMSMTSIAGWEAEATYNGAVIKREAQPKNIQDLYKKESAATSAASSGSGN